MARTTKKKDTTAPATAPEVKEAPQAGQEAAQEAPEVKDDAQPTQEQEGQQTPPEAPQEAPEQFAPYDATVAVPLVVVRRGTAPRPEDKPIGTMTGGARVTVTAIVDGYAILANGTYVKADYLSQRPAEN